MTRPRRAETLPHRGEARTLHHTSEARQRHLADPCTGGPPVGIKRDSKLTRLTQLKIYGNIRINYVLVYSFLFPYPRVGSNSS